MSLNASTHLLDTINSVLDQTYRNFEIIVKDGGSVDNSLNLLPKKEEIILIKEHDSGIYDAMNQALEHCKGKYILFLNAGDVLSSSEIFEKLAPYCLKEKAAYLIYTDYFLLQYNSIVYSPARLSDFFLYRTMLCHQACFLQREAYKQYGNFDTSFKIVADYDLLTRYVIQKKITHEYVPIVSTKYMGGGFSSKTQNQKIAKKEVIRIRRNYYNVEKRVMFGLLLYMTFPSIRKALFRYTALKPIALIYIKVINFINRRRIKT